MNERSILAKKALRQYRKALVDIFSSNPVAVGEKIANTLYWKNRKADPIFRCFKEVYGQDLRIHLRLVRRCQKCGVGLEANKWVIYDKIKRGKIRFCPKCDTPKKYYKDAKVYAAYMESEDWIDKREDALVRANNRCERCESRNDLQVHHRTYLRLGNERPDDLVVLCQSCHKWLHKMSRVVCGWE